MRQERRGRATAGRGHGDASPLIPSTSKTSKVLGAFHWSSLTVIMHVCSGWRGSRGPEEPGRNKHARERCFLDLPNLLSSILTHLFCQTPVCSFLSSKQRFGFNVLDQRASQRVSPMKSHLRKNTTNTSETTLGKTGCSLSPPIPAREART